MDMEKPKRTTLSPEARQQSILDAALPVFIEKGFAATLLDDIARAAGVSKGLVYNYFDSKEHLFQEIVKRAVLPFVAQAEAMVKDFDGDVHELSRRLIKGWWAFSQQGALGGLPKLIIAESNNLPEIARFYYQEVILKSHHLVEQVLRRGIAEGKYRDLDVPYTVRAVIAPVVFAAIWQHSLAAFEEVPLDVDRYLDVVIDVMNHGVMKS